MSRLSKAAMKRREDRRGWLMMGGVGSLALAGVVGLALVQPEPVDAATGCVKDEPVSRRVVLVVDVSDRWPEAEARVVRAALAAEVRAVGVGERLTMVMFTGAESESGEVLLDRCRPPEGKDVHALVATPAKADQEFAASFGEPLSQAIDKLAGGSAKETHLISYLANLSARISYEGGAEKLEFVVFSDMAENTSAGTLLKGKGKRKPMSSEEFASYAAAVAGERLQGIGLQVRAMLPPGGVAASERIKEAWVAAVAGVGGDIDWRGL